MFSLKHLLSSKEPASFYHPWFYFLIFTVANTILAYSGSNFLFFSRMSSIVLFIFAPLALFSFLKNTPQKDPLYLEEILPVLSPKWFWLIAFFGFLPRFYILFNPGWPISDEGLTAFISTELAKKWSWHFFFTCVQSPPLNNWLQAIYFKWITPSIFSMRSYYFILSVVAGFLCFFTAKIFFSRSMVLSCVSFVALSFWPLYTSRFSMYTQTLFTFEMIALMILGTFLNSKSIQDDQKNSWKLGIVTGLGFWVAIQWPLAAFMIVIAVIFKFKNKTLSIKGFWISVFLFFGSFLLLSVNEKYGQYAAQLLKFPSHGEWLARLNNLFSNGTSLFWGCDLNYSYGPVWGGILNPISGSLFFIGFFELIRHRKNLFSQWILTAFFIFMTPGLITNTFEIFRNLLVLPLLIFICALGLQSLLHCVSTRWRVLSFLIIILSSTGLDLVHLWKTYQPNPSSSYSSIASQFSKAYHLLKTVNEEKGPGEIFLGFNSDISDQTLDIATYSFNAAENSKLSIENIQWAAFIANANYKPFLSDQYPRAKFYWLGPDGFWNQGGLMLVIINKDEKNWPKLKLWADVNSLFCAVTAQLFLDPLNKNGNVNFEQFSEAEKLINDNRFLESIFYEKLMYFQRGNPNKHQLINWLKMAAKRGYPASHLLVTEGLLLRAEGNYTAARVVFKEALHSRLNLTDAQKNLESLNLFKNGQ